MRVDVIGSASAGFIAVAGTWLAQAGTSWPAVLAALAGAWFAVLEIEDFRLRVAAVVFGFNTVVGSLGGPVIVEAARQHLEFGHPALAALAAFIGGFVAHTFFTDGKRALMDRIAGRGGRK